MNHQGTKTFETPRLILRRFTMEDAPAMYRNWASDPEVTKYLTWPTHSSAEVSRQVLIGQVSMKITPSTSGRLSRRNLESLSAPLAWCG